MAKAAVTRSIRDDHQKNFLKIFNGLTGKHSRWEIWEDFVTLTAIEISNSTDKVNATERTKMYQTIISKYSAKERDGMAEMLAEVVMGMEQNPDQDFLGSLYMMCELGNDHAGQFFTPYDVCRCMAEITFDPKLHPDMEGFISVSDPACGAGATLLAFLNVCKRRNICYHNKVLVIAQDIDFIVGLMCYIQCSFMGCAGYVVIGDTLTDPATAYDSRGLLPALGYEMADDEKALQDGTHQLFAVYGSGSKADTPCDKCKAAHPECDKCCKTCDDHCNAFQLCRKEYGE